MHVDGIIIPERLLGILHSNVALDGMLIPLLDLPQHQFLAIRKNVIYGGISDDAYNPLFSPPFSHGQFQEVEDVSQMNQDTSALPGMFR
jgi:hypothetical protein